MPKEMYKIEKRILDRQKFIAKILDKYGFSKDMLSKPTYSKNGAEKITASERQMRSMLIYALCRYAAGSYEELCPLFNLAQKSIEANLQRFMDIYDTDKIVRAQTDEIINILRIS
jgi:hypothetical protein